VRPRAVAALLAAAALAPAGRAADRRALTVDDLFRLKSVSEPQLSPDGAWVAYVVETTDVKKDASQSDLWMAAWDGSREIRLTSTGDSDESSPRFSPDGKRLAFLSDRGEDDATTQVWALDLAGGEAQRLTDVEGEVEEFAWAPDSRRLALVVRDPKPKAKQNADGEDDDEAAALPIVVDRYQFKQDGVGYLDARRSHLYVYDLDAKQAALLTPGTNDEGQASWSPDGRTLAFVSKRVDADPDRSWNWDVFVIDAKAGSTPRRVTTSTASDASPDYDGGPRFSPDGRTLAFLRTTDPSYRGAYYGVPVVSLVPAAGGEPLTLAGDADRNLFRPTFSPDGGHLYFRLEDDRSVELARVPVAGGALERLSGRGRVVGDFAIGAQGRIAVLAATPSEPPEVHAFENGRLRALSHQNDALLATLQLGAVEELESVAKDGAKVGSMVVKPPGFAPGRRYPTLLYIHGGPNAQDQHEFDAWAQLYAAQGYLVVQPNYRGSVGRGYAWASAMVGDWGNLEVLDVLSAVDAAIAKGWADEKRLGVLGWSYGGMLTNYVIASDTRFKAAASGAGVANMLTGYGTDQYVITYEQELGLPWKTQELYLKTSYPFFHADRIKTPTLFACGEKDWNVPLVNSEQMYQALKSLGVDTQLVIYPGQSHSLSRPSYERDLAVRHLAWFGKRLSN
jgi:dipeptidyl aminopeptidase/acylaminoacyl peptidase